MSENKRGLGRGLAALIPSGSAPRERYRPGPVDAYFPAGRTEREQPVAREEGGETSPTSTRFENPSGPIGDAESDRVAGAAPGSSETSGSESSGSETPASEAPASEAPASEFSAVAAGAGVGDDGQPQPAAEEQLREVTGVSVAELPLDAVAPNAQQPRQVFDEAEISELAGSIATVGLLQPVVVRPIGPQTYELVMGERRWRACREAGLATIPAIIRETDDGDMLRDALLENLHRVQLNPLEEAAAYEQLLEDFGCTHDVLATRLSRSRPQITNTLRLLRLPALVQRRVAAGVLSAGHARALLGLDDPAAIERLAQRIVAEGLSVRAVEEIVALGGEDADTSPRPRGRRTLPVPESASAIASRLTEHLDTSVSVAVGRRKGKLTIEFATMDDLERIGALLGVATVGGGFDGRPIPDQPAEAAPRD
jgi:ParB family chromosome partitioning protein